MGREEGMARCFNTKPTVPGSRPIWDIWWLTAWAKNLEYGGGAEGNWDASDLGGRARTGKWTDKTGSESWNSRRS